MHVASYMYSYMYPLSYPRTKSRAVLSSNINLSYKCEDYITVATIACFIGGQPKIDRHVRLIHYGRVGDGDSEESEVKVVHGGCTGVSDAILSAFS